MKKRIRLFPAILSLFVLLFSGCGEQPAGPSGSSPEAPGTKAPVSASAEETKEAAPAVREGVPTDGNGWYLWDEKGKTNLSGRSAEGTQAVVSSSKVEASRAGLEILKKGGNAIDAAIATAFALSVVEPNSSGIGGGGFMLIRTAGGQAIFLNFRETAPRGADPALFEKDAAGQILNSEKSVGGKAVCVPGEIAGLWEAYEKYGSGKMSWAELIEPAVRLAEEGFPITGTLAADIAESYEYLLKDEYLSELFLDDGFQPEQGFLLKNPDYAGTLRLLAEGGRDAFYQGTLSKEIADAVQAAGGFLTAEDLAAYEVQTLEPVRGSYRGYTVLSSPLPSSGGTHVIEALNILENFDLASFGFGSAEELHLKAQTFQWIFKDRAAYMGDPNYVAVPQEGLISRDYAKAVAAQFDPAARADFSDIDPWDYEHTDTTHFSVADAAGNMVAVTQTVNLAFGAKLAVPGRGFVLNDEMGDFSADPESPNAIAPGKTPLSSMSPTILLDPEGKPFLVLGSPGSVRIITTVTQVISNVIDYGMDLQAAVDAPRIYVDTDGIFRYEDRFGAEVIGQMEALGYETQAVNAYYHSYGAVQGVQFGPDRMLGGADPRRDGKALAY
ncbi:MAG: gamma-glutamyltransferase [Lachnospiraceae bacterium]|nr:gamma-glutamyltransferase [Lachnospiraceae bacterium]